MSSLKATCETPTIAIISAGAMGCGLASRLISHNCQVLTCLDGRSVETRKRAESTGMIDASLVDIASKAQWILSVMPPGEAISFAQTFLEAWRVHSSSRSTAESNNDSDKAGGTKDYDLVFVDCNAKSPETAKKFAALFAGTGIPFIDAAILGLPPHETHDPSIYASADIEDHGQTVLRRFAGLCDFGLRVIPLTGTNEVENVGIGAASAVKMAFSGIMKGMVGVYTAMILSACSHSPTVASTLLLELEKSLPQDLERIGFYVPNSFAKAYRFPAEMNEMASFVRNNIDLSLLSSKFSSKSGNTEEIYGRSNATGDVGQIFDGLASLYQRVADSASGSDGGRDVSLLQSFAEQAKRRTER